MVLVNIEDEYAAVREQSWDHLEKIQKLTEQILRLREDLGAPDFVAVPVAEGDPLHILTVALAAAWEEYNPVVQRYFELTLLLDDDTR